MGYRLRAGKPPLFVTSHPGQLSLLPSVGRKMSTSHSAMTLCGWRLKACIVHSTCGWVCGWQVKLCDPSLTRAIPECLRDEFLMIKHCTNLRLLYFTSSRNMARFTCCTCINRWHVVVADCQLVGVALAAWHLHNDPGVGANASTRVPSAPPSNVCLSFFLSVCLSVGQLVGWSVGCVAQR